MRKYLISAVAAAMLATPAAALANGPTPGPEAGPGCFGLWRAGSVQVIDQAGGNAGADYFSVRAGSNSTINAENRAQCAAL